MKSKTFITIALIVLWAAAGAPWLKRSLFPGAEGYGALASGGRGKPAVVVTNLNDDGPGSFRQAVSHDGATVVFSTSGIIHLKSNILLPSDLTIAGQTAPGTGITIADAKVSMTDAHNIIIRYMRFRGGIAEARGSSSLILPNAPANSRRQIISTSRATTSMATAMAGSTATLSARTNSTPRART